MATLRIMQAPGIAMLFEGRTATSNIIDPFKKPDKFISQ
jgi:hypothetical protein